MNKKFLVGLSSLAIAGTFLACGEGDIYQLSIDDDGVQVIYVEANDTAWVRKNMELCANDVSPNGCAEKMKQAGGSSNPNPSNPNNGNQNQTTTSSSNNGTPLPVQGSSSSIFIPQRNNSSSSSAPFNPGTEVSSSSISIPSPNVNSSDLGSCAPEVSPVDKGSSASWKFTYNKANAAGVQAMDLLKYEMIWTFSGEATPSTPEQSGTYSALQKTTVSYSASGVGSASVVIKNGPASYSIKCTDVQVNGDPITGCTCAPAKDATDYLSDPDISWTVTGCKTTAAGGAISYAWDGVAGTDTFTKTFTAATASYAPKLQVANEDKTVIDVTCGAVKVTEGAEYTIKDNTDAGKVTLPGPGKYNVVIGFACQNKTFFCNGVGGPVGGSVNGTPMASSWYTTASLSADDCSGSASVVVEVDQAATCGAQ